MKKQFVMSAGVAALAAASLVPQAHAGPPTTGYDSEVETYWVDNGNSRWELDTNSWEATHENRRGRGGTNTISLGDFLETWYDANELDAATGSLSARFSCHGAGTTTWTAGHDLDVRWIVHPDAEDGGGSQLLIAFDADETPDQSGAAAYVIEDVQHPTTQDIAPSTHHGHFGEIYAEGGSFSGLNANAEPGQYLLDFSHSLGNNGVTFHEDATRSWFALPTSSIDGYNHTNCGADDPVQPTSSVIWTIDSTDIY